MSEPGIENDLKNIVGDRVTVSEFERWCYTHDILHLPRLVKGLFKTMPVAIVKPNSVDQVSQVAGYCNRKDIPLTVRGGGSSGLFAAVPKRGGVVLDTLDLNTVFEIDEEHETVTAQAGITWWEMEKRLNARGLTLRSYPSSARSATLGGWVMTSGLGIGSLKYGPVFDQLEAIQIVYADGSVKEYEMGFGLSRFSETEGILGIFTRVKLKVRRIPEQAAHHLVYFQSISDLFEAVYLLTRREPLPYSLELIDDGYLLMLRKSDYPAPEPVPGSGALVVSYDGLKRDVHDAEKRLSRVVEDCYGVVQEGAEEFWRERFDILRIRRAVPSLIPSNVYIPLERLERYYAGLQNVSQRICGVIGHVVSSSQCDLMPMIATDEKHPVEYMFSLHTPREISNLAISMGGKPGGGIGVWNAPYRNEILGKRRLNRARILKRAHDPGKTLNPRMWLDPPALFTPAIYHTAMQAMSIVDGLFPSPKSREQSGWKKELAVCVQCGYCMNVCPTKLEWLSTTPRGRVLATRELFLDKPQKRKDFAPEYINRLYQCTMCGRCGIDCNVDIKSRAMWLGVRKHLAANGLVPESLKELVKLTDEYHNIAGRPNDQRANWTSRLKLPYDLKSKRSAPVVYFVGCVASFFPMVQPSARAFVQIMDTAGVDFTIAGGEEWCCGFPLLATGDTESTARTFRHNLERMKDIGAQTIVTACPGCYKTWKHEYEEAIDERHPFTVLHATEFIARLLEQNKLNLKGFQTTVTYHDPCDLGRNARIFDE
ncbi:MAG: FAD-binding and (Fe-S)-binding domain-containing protein, partial [Dehalococcoidia bacterium]|nr:FAD-binding and (Fe-S)-binding domain-containing protein [Dehalococcoidia bacterium]